MGQVGLLEDNARIAKLCAMMLHYGGHQVTTYRHPLECLQALLPARMPGNHLATCLSREPFILPIDVLILDLYLPDINGIEVVHYLHSSPCTRFMPLIFCTAAPLAEVERALRIAPHARFVEKPFKLDALMDAVTKALKAQV
jgi:CheY-like chemotaxis protein